MDFELDYQEKQGPPDERTVVKNNETMINYFETSNFIRCFARDPKNIVANKEILPQMDMATIKAGRLFRKFHLVTRE